jgi:ABC-type branched-subunit amino acid transport system substrate-binding protein
MQRSLRSWWILAALTAAVLFVMGACGDSGDGGDSDGTPQVEATSGPVATRTPYPAELILTKEQILEKDPSVTKTEVLKIGWMFEISGPPEVQNFGIPTGDGVKIAVQEINDAGGFQVGDTIYTIELVERDTQSDIPNTRAIAQELVQDEGVKVIFGPATLGETEATQVTQAGEVIHLCPCQERELNALSSVEKAHGESRWAFQTLLPFSLLVEDGARSFSTEWPDLHSMAFLCQNSRTGHDICERTRDAYARYGVEIVGDIQYFPPGTTDFTPFLTRIKAGDPDYLYNYDDPLNTTAIVKQALQLGVGRLHLVTVPANLAEALIGVPLTVPVTAGAAPRQFVQPTSPEAAEFAERYKEYLNGGDLPLAGFVSLMTYDYVFMVAGAMQQAESVDDTTAIAEKLEALHYDGVAEDDLFFNSRHLAVHGTEPCVVQTGKPITCTHNPAPPEAYQE